MNVEDLVQERIAAARRKIAADKQRRQELNAARQRGLAYRHAAKLKRLAESAEHQATTEPGDQAPEGPVPTPVARTRAGMHEHWSQR
ncbi:hypothetical protein [Streptomyces sp. NPDC056500]|uniref:hypothetical protein n=1 Tax=unclassified Streptomyces TaxID=2593676 RepID=UPI00369F7F81